MVRQPFVAGRFYESSPAALRQQLEQCFKHPLGPGELPAEGSKERSIVAMVCPHAGYPYSGPTAARSYHRLSQEKPPEVVVVVGPNHSGMGTAAAVYPTGKWVTPLGEVKINEEIAEGLLSECPYARADPYAHVREHSLEVQVPFLQFCLRQPFQIVPIAISRQVPEVVESLGKSLAAVLKDKNAVVIASSDLSHEQGLDCRQRVIKQDKLALDKLAAFDPDGIMELGMTEKVTMCGYGAIAATLWAAKEMGASQVEVLGYSNSADLGGAPDYVVGYVAAVVTWN